MVNDFNYAAYCQNYRQKILRNIANSKQQNITYMWQKNKQKHLYFIQQSKTSYTKKLCTQLITIVTALHNCVSSTTSNFTDCADGIGNITQYFSIITFKYLSLHWKLKTNFEIYTKWKVIESYIICNMFRCYKQLK